MNILMFNQDWFAKDWKQQGHSVLTIGVATHLDIVISGILYRIDALLDQIIPSDFIPDLIIYHDNSSALYIKGFEYINIPTFFYSVDTHHHYQLHKYYPYIFDEVAIAQKDYMNHFNENNFHPMWLPLWASREVMLEDVTVDKNIDVSFVGSLNKDLNPERVSFFESLSKKIPINITTGEYWKIFPKSKIVINQTVKKDLNFRVFEAMMCGTVLLTEKIENGLLELFEEDTDLVLYEKNNVEDAESKILSLLSDSSKIKRISEQCRNKILANHTEKNRADFLLNKLENIKVKEGKQAFLPLCINYANLGVIIFKESKVNALNAFLESILNLEKALCSDEIMHPNFSLYALLGIYGYEIIMKDRKAFSLFESLINKYPNDVIFKMAFIRECLNKGDYVTAKNIAITFTDKNVSEVFSHSDQVVSKLISENFKIF